MKYVFPALIEWTFDLEEVSANVYEVTATDGVPGFIPRIMTTRLA